MTHQERLRQALKYLGYKNKEFAHALGLTPVYVSRLLTQTDRKMSPQLAENIENKFGISADWLMTGAGEMICTFSKLPNLRGSQKELAAELEKLDLDQLVAVRAFVKLLKQNKRDFAEVDKKNKVDEYTKFLEWQNSQKEKK